MNVPRKRPIHRDHPQRPACTWKKVDADRPGSHEAQLSRGVILQYVRKADERVMSGTHHVFR